MSAQFLLTVREQDDPYLHPYTLAKPGPQIVLRFVKYEGNVKYCLAGRDNWIPLYDVLEEGETES